MAFRYTSTPKSGPRGFSAPNLASIALRFLQTVFALAVIGLYAQDLRRAAQQHKYADSKWVFAVATASLSAATGIVVGALVAWAGFASVSIIFPWDGVLVVLWAAVVGIFGSMYVGENPEMDAGVERMKDAVWVDLVCLGLWCLGAGWGGWMWWRARGRGGGAWEGEMKGR